MPATARFTLALRGALCALLVPALSQDDASPPFRCELDGGWNGTAPSRGGGAQRVTLQRDNWNSHFLVTEAAKIVSDASVFCSCAPIAAQPLPLSALPRPLCRS